MGAALHQVDGCIWDFTGDHRTQSVVPKSFIWTRWFHKNGRAKNKFNYQMWLNLGMLFLITNITCNMNYTIPKKSQFYEYLSFYSQIIFYISNSISQVFRWNNNITALTSLSLNYSNDEGDITSMEFQWYWICILEILSLIFWCLTGII